MGNGGGRVENERGWRSDVEKKGGRKSIGGIVVVHDWSLISSLE